jgi:hypothetical protein
MASTIRTLWLADAPLKHLLRLFAPDAPLRIQALGDTQHPSAGYVDEALVRGIAQVSELLAFPYDFAGLVNFEATVADIMVAYHGEHYQLTGPPKAMQRLLAQLQHLNALLNAGFLTALEAGYQ